MRFESILLANSTTTSGGLLNILGGGITRTEADLPTELKLSCITTWVFEEGDLEKTHDLRLEFRDQNEEVVRQLALELHGPDLRLLSAIPGERLHIQIVADMNGTPVEAEGLYWFVAFIDGDERGRYPLAVVEPRQDDDSVNSPM